VLRNVTRNVVLGHNDTKLHGVSSQLFESSVSTTVRTSRQAYQNTKNMRTF